MRFFLLFLIANSFMLTYAQGTGSIHGKVIDYSTKQALSGVNIVVEGTSSGASTDINGEYTISGLPVNTYRIKASLIGFTPVIKTDIFVTPGKAVHIDIEMNASSLELEGVTISSNYFDKNPNQVNSIKYFSYEEIRRSPGGFEDVIRTLAVLPGVGIAEQGRNDLIVRGGAPSENLFVVDGIQIPNINHFGTQGSTGGPLSYINLDFVKETSFSTGGFPVLYGDKLSSVLTINLRNGRTDKIGGKVNIAATQFGLNLEGPLTEKSNFLISARRSYLDFIFKAAGFGFVPEYYDLLTKFEYSVDNHNNITFIMASAFDNVKYFNETEDQRYDNSNILGSDQKQYFTGLKYRHLFDNGFFDIILNRNFTDYNTSQRDSLLNPLFINESLEGENGITADAVYKFSNILELNAGAGAKFTKFNAAIYFKNFKTTFQDSLQELDIKVKDNFEKYSFYTNLIVNPTNRISANFGIRGDYYGFIKEKFYLSPRFSLLYRASELLNFNFSTGIFYQSPSYIWLASFEENRNLKAIKAEQYIFGMEYLLSKETQLKIEGFVKRYKDYPASTLRKYLVLANTGAGYLGTGDNFSSFGLEKLVSEGSGITRGVEFSIQKKLSEIPLYGLLSLTYSKTNFTSLDNIERTGTYDQTWLFNISSGYKIGNEWEIGMKFRYATGRPYTPFNSDGSQDVMKYNTGRLPENHSLDLRVDKYWLFENWTLITYIDIQNVYGRQNKSSLRWDARKQAIDDETGIGILPSIGISAEF